MMKRSSKAKAKAPRPRRRSWVPLWLVETLDIVWLRRRLLLSTVVVVVATGIAATLLVPEVVPTVPVVGAALGFAALLLGLAVVIAVDAGDLAVRGPRHVRAAGGELVAILPAAAGPTSIAPLADAALDARGPDSKLILGFATAGDDVASTRRLTDELAIALARRDVSVLRADLAGGFSSGPGLYEVAREEIRLARAVSFETDLKLAWIGPGRDVAGALAAILRLPSMLPRDLDVFIAAFPTATSKQVVRAAASLDHVLLVVRRGVTSRVDLIAALDALDTAGCVPQVVLLDDRCAQWLGVQATAAAADQQAAVEAQAEPESAADPDAAPELGAASETEAGFEAGPDIASDVGAGAEPVADAGVAPDPVAEESAPTLDAAPSAEAEGTRAPPSERESAQISQPEQEVEAGLAPGAAINLAPEPDSEPPPEFAPATAPESDADRESAPDPAPDPAPEPAPQSAPAGQSTSGRHESSEERDPAGPSASLGRDAAGFASPTGAEAPFDLPPLPPILPVGEAPAAVQANPLPAPEVPAAEARPESADDDRGDATPETRVPSESASGVDDAVQREAVTPRDVEVMVSAAEAAVATEVAEQQVADDDAHDLAAPQSRIVSGDPTSPEPFGHAPVEPEPEPADPWARAAVSLLDDKVLLDDTHPTDELEPIRLDEPAPDSRHRRGPAPSDPAGSDPNPVSDTADPAGAEQPELTLTPESDDPQDDPLLTTAQMAAILEELEGRDERS